MTELSDLAVIGTDCLRAVADEDVTYFELADFAGMAESLEILSACAGGLGNGLMAARGCGSAEVQRKSVRTPHFPSQGDTYHAMVAAARRGVDQAVWSAAWAEGVARPDEAIAEMLGQP